ncbi:hypothetical protein ABW19_dt0201647 [Dactylella cylindrospora]|nr:hypothetical protein ABW19_dt0201647 [Dactylella cylindrospora]
MTAEADYDYEINLLYEKSHTTPDEPTADTKLSRLELWFSNSASATPQHIYLDVHRDESTDATSYSNSLLNQFLSAEHDTIVEATSLVAGHLAKLAKDTPSSNLTNHSRFGFSLSGDSLSDPLPPPAISHTAIISDPQIPKIHYTTLKFLEAREIRPNIRIAKAPAGTTEQPTKCLYKAVDFAREALSLSFEVTNYKRLVAKGPQVEKWLVKLVGLVYIHDVEDDSPKDIELTDESAIEEDLEEVNTQFIGALFIYHPQRDLTTHYAINIPTEIKTCWLRQLVSAIAALEEAGFEHWDLKCENIVLDTADGLPDEIFTSHITASEEISTARDTLQRSRLERRSSTASTKPSLINPGKLRIIDLENSKSSAAFRPIHNSSSPTQRSHRLSVSSSRRDSVEQHPELGISMVYAMGKTILEMWNAKMPEVGDPTEDEMRVLTEPARVLVERCCLAEARITAVEARQLLEEMFKQHTDDESVVLDQ